mmetsp:Transcript_21768/g.46893  ORF Transcript_21768/g.46893 Transcript_21768/m.46893 type:complete len:221 (+) Transcript_21768:198-860(+)
MYRWGGRGERGSGEQWMSRSSLSLDMVSVQVLVQHRPPGEGPLAAVARAGVDAGLVVRLHVPADVGAIGEALSAALVLAAVRALSRVGAHVSLECGALREGPAARVKLTHERAVAGVALAVTLEAEAGAEAGVAARVLAREEAIGSALHVLVEVLLRGWRWQRSGRVERRSVKLVDAHAVHSALGLASLARLLDAASLATHARVAVVASGGRGAQGPGVG